MNETIFDNFSIVVYSITAVAIVGLVVSLIQFYLGSPGRRGRR